MTDIERAKIELNGHSIALCLGDIVIVNDKKGIAPMIEFFEQNLHLQGFSVADLIVGKAAAMLFVKAGVKEVFAKVISKGGIAILQKFNIPYTYEIVADNIINRKGDDICPMEKVVADIEDIDLAYLAIKNKLQQIKSAENRY